MLLPFEGQPVLAEPSSPKRRKPREELPESSDEPEDSSVSSSDEDVNRRETSLRYIPPHRRRRHRNDVSAMGDMELRQDNESRTDSGDSRPRARCTSGKKVSLHTRMISGSGLESSEPYPCFST